MGIWQTSTTFTLKTYQSTYNQNYIVSNTNITEVVRNTVQINKEKPIY